MLSRPPRRDGDGDRGQLLRLLQEGSQDPDQFRGQPVRLVREEHAGGAMAFATYVLGQDFQPARSVSLKKTSFERAMACWAIWPSANPRLCDRPRYSEIYYVPEDAVFSVRDCRVTWERGGIATS